MVQIGIAEESSRVSWRYDPEADVLYLAIGQPKAAIGVDIGDGVIARYDEDKNILVGLTVVGLKQRLQRELVPD